MNLHERNNLWATVERLLKQLQQCETARVRNRLIRCWETFPESEGRAWTVEEIREAVAESNRKRIADKERVVFEPINS